jgi:2'-deoxynucleoside 5'-phosphate N-hydrolase
MSKNKKVVFFAAASPKRVPKSQVEIYHKIIDAVKKQGNEISLDWLDTRKHKKLSDAEIYNMSMNFLKKSDLLLSEVSYPSIGIGEQIAFAIQKKIPVICLYNRKIEDNPSKLLPRTKPNLLQLFPYEKANIENVLAEALSGSVNKNFEKFNFVITSQLNKYLLNESKRRNMSKSEFLRHIIEDWKKKS